MRPWALRIAVVLLVVVAFLGGLGVGSYGRSSSSGGSANAPSRVVSITAAGTLAGLFPTVGNALVNETPGVSAPLAAQQYEGSLLALGAITQLHQQYDVAAAADFRLIPRLLEPTYAGFECVFATTPEALAYDPSVAAFSGINATNWPEKLLASGEPLAIANASTDPNGYNEVFVLQLEGLVENGSLGAVYGHYFTTPVGALAEPNPSTTRVEPETAAATLIETHAVAAFIIYQSYAVAHHLSYVPLDPRVSLGALDPADVAFYAHASTTILASNGSIPVTGAPVAFSVTVPVNAPNATLGLAFVHLLLSPEGSALIQAAGFVPVFPGWVDRPSAVPSILAPDVVPLPSGLAAMIP